MSERNNTPIESTITVIDTNILDYNDFYEDFKEFCKDNGYTLVGEGSEMEGLYLGGRFSFSQYMNDVVSRDCEDFWENLRLVKKSPYNDFYVVTGTLGLWNGRRGGICETFESLYDACSKCSTDAYDIIVKCDGKKVDFDCMHHDGTNTFEIYRLNWDDYDKVRYWEDGDGDVFDFIEKHAQPITYEMLGL